jgi:hypothetical protein
VEQALAKIRDKPDSYAILDLDSQIFCQKAISEQNRVGEATECLLGEFCNENSENRFSAGILLQDILRNNLAPIPDSVSDKHLKSLFSISKAS